jgi:hypothetical protein
VLGARLVADLGGRVDVAVAVVAGGVVAGTACVAASVAVAMRLRSGDATATAVTTGGTIVAGPSLRQAETNRAAVNSKRSGHEPDCKRRYSPLSVYC